MRIAQVVATDAFAGTERYAYNLSAGLTRLGAQVVLVGGNTEHVLAAQRQAGTEVPHVPAAGTVPAYRQLRSLAKLDLVHVHLTSSELAAVLAFPRPSRVPIVCTRHFAARRGASIGGRMVVPLIRARLDGQLSISEYVAAKVDGRSQVILTGIPSASSGAHDQPVVTVAQRLQPEKDTATALRAWACSGLSAYGWELHIAGEGTEIGELQKLAAELGIEGSTRFLGHVPDLGQRLSHAAVLLATAPAEPLGLSVIEAMANGLPVVATAAGGHLETVGTVSRSFLFPPGDHARAAALLAQLAGDPVLRQRYGGSLRSGQESRFSFNRYLEQVVAWYVGILAQRRPVPQRGPDNIGL